MHKKKTLSQNKWTGETPCSWVGRHDYTWKSTFWSPSADPACGLSYQAYQHRRHHLHCTSSTNKLKNKNRKQKMNNLVAHFKK